MPDSEAEHPMTEPIEIRLSLADILAELVLGAMAREVETDEGDEEAEITASSSIVIGESPRRTS
jgi:hypothetical protein